MAAIKLPTSKGYNKHTVSLCVRLQQSELISQLNVIAHTLHTASDYDDFLVAATAAAASATVEHKPQFTRFASCEVSLFSVDWRSISSMIGVARITHVEWLNRRTLAFFTVSNRWLIHNWMNNKNTDFSSCDTINATINWTRWWADDCSTRSIFSHSK